MFPLRRRTFLDNVTVLIKTFQRPQTVNSAIRSIRRFYPGLHILVGDDSPEPTPIDDPQTVVHTLPFDTGLGRGRNLLLAEVRTPYFFLMDDDHHFTRRTRLETLRSLLEVHRFDILGCVPENVVSRSWRNPFGRIPSRFFMNMRHDDDTLAFDDEHHEKTPAFVRCDLIENCFLGRTERVRATGGWDDRLKVAEHADFFLTAKEAGLNVGYTPLVRLDHRTVNKERRALKYKMYRYREPEFRKIWIKKRGIRRLYFRDGSEKTAEEFINRTRGHV